MLHIYDPIEYKFSNEIFSFHFSKLTKWKENAGFISPGELGSLDDMTTYLKNAGVKYRISVNSFPTSLK